MKPALEAVASSAPINGIKASASGINLPEWHDFKDLRSLEVARNPDHRNLVILAGLGVDLRCDAVDYFLRDVEELHSCPPSALGDFPSEPNAAQKGRMGYP